MMLRIAVCENDRRFEDKFKNYLKTILEGMGSKCEIFLFKNTNELYKFILKWIFEFDLLFINWEADEDRTSCFLRAIRRRETDSDVIIMTDQQIPVQKLIEYKVFSCLEKKAFFSRIQETMRYYLWVKMQHKEYLNFSFRGKKEKVALNQILYMESIIRKVLIYTEDATLEYYGKLDDAQRELAESGFIRCHQSFLVNTKSVIQINRTSIEVKGKTVPVSRRYVKKVREFIKSNDIENLEEPWDSGGQEKPWKKGIWITKSLAINEPKLWEINCDI